MTDFNDDLIELQTRLAYQEDTIAQLNAVITQQDADLRLMQQQLKLLAKRVDELSFSQEQGGISSDNERPPHY